MNAHDEQLWEEINTRPEVEMIHVQNKSGSWKMLCGATSKPGTKYNVAWDKRKAADCDKCVLYVSVAEANDIGPSEFGQSLSELIFEILGET